MKVVFYSRGNIFLSSPGGGTAFIQWFCLSLHPTLIHIKNMSIWKIKPCFVFWSLWATLRFLKSTFAFISVGRRTFLEEFEKLCLFPVSTLSRSIVLWCGFIWHGLENSVRHVLLGKNGRYVVRAGVFLLSTCINQFSSFLFSSVLLNEPLCLVFMGKALTLDRTQAGSCGPQHFL